MRKGVATIFAVVWLGAVALQASAAPEASTIYDPNPNHLWNWLNETLFQRTAPDGKKYGLNELDILYWYRTTNLLAGASHQQALSGLDEFIRTHGEKLIHDPLKKALLQRDLWALFDWSVEMGKFSFTPECRELQKRLATVIRRLELMTNEIASLPDNYTLAEKNNLPELPHGLFQTNSDWINVGVNGAELTVPAHVLGFGGRSIFTVWFHDADGRAAGLDYLRRLGAVTPKFVTTTNQDHQAELQLNPSLPQFPANSEWALARCLCVVDADGRIRPTHFVESLQVRHYLTIAPPATVLITNQNGFVVPASVPPQHFNEFRMSRDSQAILVSIPQDGRAFTSNNHFFSMGFDPFESSWAGQTNRNSLTYQTRVLKTCVECHDSPGIYSVNSFTRFLSGGSSFQVTQMVEFDPYREASATTIWKEGRFEWGLLQGLWSQAD